MINLLPHERKNILNKLYKQHLSVAFITMFSFALLPLVITAAVLSFGEYINLNILNKEYETANETLTNSGLGGVIQNLANTNDKVSFLKNDFKKSKSAHSVLQKIISLRPNNIRINYISYSGSDKTNTIVITGVADNREAVISFGSILNSKENKICSNVKLPVSTYTKKIDVPFTVTCDVIYE